MLTVSSYLSDRPSQDARYKMGKEMFFMQGSKRVNLNSDSEQFCTWGHYAMSEALFECHNYGGVTGIQWVKARHAAKCLACTGQHPTT